MSWSDLLVGVTFDSPSRTITETDVVMFAGTTADYSPIHVDHEFARASQFGGVIAHGLLGLSIAHGLMFGGGLLGRNAIAFLGIKDWNFRAPILLGDTIHVEFEVVERRRRSSVPDQGIVTFAVRVVNQRDHVVQEGRKALLLHAPS
ncbi:MaoC family dehydratase N-terminal domain-containing protein [Mycobacterium yunnanensis]|uniref:MaoC family dehydratase N-terminal domain-containing protein n=1 Tax=Mycobacterium yunnanensis TaxID=368477 RepID=A0A9X2Z537_9MYCO|nr:MaoC family dehydratase N-terminal domain-containing protein [Mycobacterium yunnanensis]